MANWYQFRVTDANTNIYDRYQSPTVWATVFRRGRELFGWTSNHGAWGPVSCPPQGNVQTARIFPEGDHWTVYVITDIDDQHRAEWGLAVAPL